MAKRCTLQAAAAVLEVAQGAVLAAVAVAGLGTVARLLQIQEELPVGVQDCRCGTLRGQVSRASAAMGQWSTVPRSQRSSAASVVQVAEVVETVAPHKAPFFPVDLEMIALFIMAEVVEERAWPRLVVTPVATILI